MDRADVIAHWAMTKSREGCGEGVRLSAATSGLVSCGQCRFWRANPDGGLDPQNRGDARRAWWREAGHCVRCAPDPSSEPGYRGFWRATHISDTCGEGQVR
jgi:hypothetical protein